MKSIKWLSLIVGILLVILGVFMLFTPITNLFTIAWVISLSLLFSGIIMIVTYFSSNKIYRSGWMLMDGILSTVIGAWIIFGRNIENFAIIIPFVFAVWIMAVSIIRAVGSLSLKSMGFRQWGWTLALGILGIVLGILLIYSPVASFISVSILISTLFIAYGAGGIALFFNLNSVEKTLDNK